MELLDLEQEEKMQLMEILRAVKRIGYGLGGNYNSRFENRSDRNTGKTQIRRNEAFCVSGSRGRDTGAENFHAICEV